MTHTQSIFKKAFLQRESLFHNPCTTAFRLFNGAANGIDGVTIDIYGEYLLLQIYNQALHKNVSALFSPLVKAAESLPVAVKGIICKDRTVYKTLEKIPETKRSSLIEGQLPPSLHIVLQNGIKIEVDLCGGQHTGLFLDVRTVRERLLPYYSRCTTMLNLFCYTGVFSVHALTNGVSYALNIDLAQSALKRAQKNYMHNGHTVEPKDFIHGDAMKWIKAFEKTGREFSFIVFDPPTFARKKKGTFSIKKDFKSSVSLLGNLAPNGIVLTVINSPDISEKRYISLHPSTWKCEFIEHESDDFSYNDTPYLKAGLWKVG